MFTEKQIILDGVSNALAAYDIQRNFYIKDKKNNSLYKNKEILLAKVLKAGYYNSLEFQIYIIIGKKSYNINNAYFNNGEYHIFDKEEKIHYICKETKDIRVSHIGYIIPNKETELNGKERVKELKDEIKKVIPLLFKINKDIMVKYTKKYIIISFTNCTGKIYITDSKNICKINMKRKEINASALVFKKDINTDNSLYVFGAKDIIESVNVDNKFKFIMQLLINKLQNNFPEEGFKYHEMQLKPSGIIIDEKELNI